MLNFSEYIAEGKGISNINKEYTEFFTQYFTQLGYGGFTIENSDNQELPLYNCLLTIKKGKPYAKFNPEFSFIEKTNIYKLYNINFLIQIENIEDISILKELISHELTHCIEYYNIIKWNCENKINNKVVQILPKHIAIQNVYTNIKVEDNNPFSNFKYLIYLTLDNEYNSRVSQLYQYLKSFKSKDLNFLKEKLKTSKPYLLYQLIDKFDSNIFIDEMITKIGLDGTIKITQELNRQLKTNNIDKLISYKFLNKTILNKNDLIGYYNKWNKMFKNKNKKHLIFLYRIIEEVISDDPLKEGYKDF